MRYFIVMINGTVHSFDTKEEADHFANVIGENNVKTRYSAY